MTIKKRCSLCGGKGPFTKDRRAKDGLDSRCRGCKSKLWKQQNPGPDRRYKTGPKRCSRCDSPGPFYKDKSTGSGKSSWCVACCKDKAKRAAASRVKYNKRVRMEALREYCGGEPRCQCELCPLNTTGVHLDFLTFDHIGGGGNEHRKQIGASSTKFVLWLRDNNYPDSIRVLCMNCNWASRHSGVCPHEMKERDL